MVAPAGTKGVRGLWDGGDAMMGHPPKPVLSLSMGVIGHRPNRLPSDALEQVKQDIAATLARLRVAVDRSLDLHRAVFLAVEPRLTVISGLAEGADRMIADAALTTGYSLDALLPFPADVYEADFAEAESRLDFRGLLGKARSVLELPGVREQHTDAYERLGITLIGLCDILVAVWDGGPPAGRGGTTSIIVASARLGMPIIHVDATGKQRPRILWGGFTQLPARGGAIADLPSLPLEEGVDRLVEELLRPPSNQEERTRLSAYLAETIASRNLRIEYPLLLALAGVRGFRRADFKPTRPEAKASAFNKQAARLLAASSLATEFGQAYGWASAVGERFAQVFRSAYVANFVLAAFAVLTAVVSLHFSNKALFAAAEVVLMVLLITNTQIGRRMNWHRRWIEAREIAERLRVTTCLWALADRPSSFHGPEPTWTSWYARACVRGQGIRPGRLDAAGLEEARAQLLALVDEQRSYHHQTARRMGRLAYRLEVFGLALFCLTFLVALDHTFGEPVMHFIVEHLPGHIDAGLLAITLAAGLPALATAGYGIRVIGDLEGAAERSEKCHHALDELHRTIVNDPPELNLLRTRARAAVDVMLSDVATWRLAVESRSLALPG